MKLQTTIRGAAAGGFALVITVVLLSVALTTLAGVLYYSHTSGIWSQRMVDRSEALAAAEAATELVVAQMQRDFRNGGEDAVFANLASYQTGPTNAVGVPAWAGFEFLRPDNGAAGTYVERTRSWGYGALPGQYGGVGYSATYRIISNVRRPWLGNAADTTNSVVAAVLEEVVLAEIPVFSFDLFYNLDLELEPGTSWTNRGRVHSNGSGYLFPAAAATLRFEKPVTAARSLIHGDILSPNTLPGGTVVYGTNYASRAGSISFRDLTGSSAHKLIEIPTGTESVVVSNAMFYNQRSNQLRIIVDSSGATNIWDSNLGWLEATDFAGALALVTIYDDRERRDVQATMVTLTNLYAAYRNNYAGATYPSLIFVDDQRPVGAGEMAGVALRRANRLEADLTFVTPRPLYVRGNVNTDGVRRRVAVAADSLTVLSIAWDLEQPHYGHRPLANRAANNEATLNMVVLTGVVPTAAGRRSGGVLNALRLLEDWSARFVQLSGSLCVPYQSVEAVGAWRHPTDDPDPYYREPSSRRFLFEPGLASVSAPALPPGCPRVITVSRLRVEDIAPGVVP